MKKTRKYFLCLIIAILVILFLPNQSKAYRPFETSTYKITEGGDKVLLTNLDPKDLTLKTIKENVTLTDDYYTICARNWNYKKLAENEKVGTASCLKLEYKGSEIGNVSLPIVVYGDTNGDGNINSADALAIIKNKLGKVKFSNDYFLEAGRITESTRKNNAVPNSADALAIIKYRLGKADISQYYQIRMTVSSYTDLYEQLEHCNTNLEFDKTSKDYEQIVSSYNKLQDIVKKYCKASMSQTTKALVLHDYLVTGTKLNYNIPYGTKLDENETNICNVGKTMNQRGFANAYTCLLGIAGIESEIVRDKYANHPDTTVNEVTIDGELYYVSCGADSHISQVEGKGKIRRYYFLRNTEQLEDIFWEDDAFFSYTPNTKNVSTSTKYLGVTWPEYRASLDYKDSEIKTANGKKIVRTSTELTEALLNGEDYVIDVYDADTESLKEVDEFCKKVIAKYITSDMSEVEKALEIHDYVCSNFTRVDHESIKESKNKTNAEYDRAWGYYKTSLLSGIGDCIGATNSFNTLCAYAGIETKTINEHQINFYHGFGNHHWSLAKIDGEWYHVDCEGADYYCYGRVDRTWFLYSDHALGGANASNTVQACTSTKYDNYKWPEFKGVAYYQDRTGIVEGKVPVTSFWIKERTETTVGATFNLQIRLFPFGANSKVTYSSSNPNVASIDSNGQITTKQKGTTTIKVSVDGITKSFVLTVGSVPQKVEINEGNPEITLKVGEKKQLTYTVTPSDAIYTIRWSTLNKDIITVDENGVITAVGEGTVNVQLTYTYTKGEYTYSSYILKEVIVKK